MSTSSIVHYSHICDNMTEEELKGIPRYANLKPFASAMFQYSPLLQEDQFPAMWAAFSAYKRQISTYGVIMLDATAQNMVLCETWTGKTYTFPAGKINQGESGLEAACRECYEETGWCPLGTNGLAATLPKTWHLSEQAVSYQEPNGGKRRTYYICIGVPLDFPFEPVARKEVASVEWFALDGGQLPKKSFGVYPVLGKLRGWIRKYMKKQGKSGKQGKGNKNASTGRPKSAGRDKSNGRRDKSNGRDKSTGRDKSNGRNSTSRSHRIDSYTDKLVDAGLANVGDEPRWSEEDMFKTNEAIIGRKVDYDGNPHVFAEQGFQGVDPHAFRVVGGGFMNSGDGLSHITDPQKQASKYQPLINPATVAGTVQGDSLPLTPFFAQDGTTPWGEVVEEAVGGVNKANQSAVSEQAGANAGEALLQMLQGGSGGSAKKNKTSKPKKNKSTKSTNRGTESIKKDEDHENDLVDVLTDAEITSQSQTSARSRKMRQEQQYEADMAFIQEWVSNLPNPTGFRIPNVDEILQQHFG